MTRCMLACEAPQNIKFPKLASPKLDGVRCLTTGSAAMSRSWKPIPNVYVQRALSEFALQGLDGELMVGDAGSPDAYRNTSSGVMSKDGAPNFTFWVFDMWDKELPFEKRLALAHKHVTALRNLRPEIPVAYLSHRILENEQELLEYESWALSCGYEGVMLRDPNGPYKNGRSTPREEYLLKVKRFSDSEAVILGFEELMHNANELEENELGYAKRTSHKDNKVPMNMLGALVVQDCVSGITFSIGTGYTKAQRIAMWQQRAEIIDQTVKYKHFEGGVKTAPRFPVFLGFRNSIDMG